MHACRYNVVGSQQQMAAATTTHAQQVNGFIPGWMLWELRQYVADALMTYICDRNISVIIISVSYAPLFHMKSISCMWLNFLIHKAFACLKILMKFLFFLKEKLRKSFSQPLLIYGCIICIILSSTTYLSISSSFIAKEESINLIINFIHKR